MAELHPALRPYKPGQLVTIPWMTKSGEKRSTRVKVVKFKVLEDGDQAVFILNTEKVENGAFAKSMIRASAIQRRIDADTAEQQATASNPLAAAPAEQATDKQVAYALALIEKLGSIGWHNSGPGQMLARPTETDLRAMSKSYISALISQLREELGYDY